MVRPKEYIDFMRNIAKKNKVSREGETQTIIQQIGISFFELAGELLRGEPKRSQEIIKKRFGISQKNTCTLDKIGQEYGITRERVRQIIADSFQRIVKKNDENLKKAEEKILFTIKKNHGIMTTAELIGLLGQGNYKEANSIAFFGNLSDKIVLIEEGGELKKAWALSRELAGEVKKIGKIALEILQKEKKLLTYEVLARLIIQAYSPEKRGETENNEPLEEQLAKYLEVFELIRENQFGKWGLIGWKEISLKGTRERVYLVLKEMNKPLHFTEIAQYIDQYKLGKRKAHPQTVHNELIKDDRFVLVGRGIYALKEWGYQQGTIRDVLRDILTQSRKSLKKQEILDRVLKIRKVKESTVMINLNNSRFFVKENDSYSIRK